MDKVILAARFTSGATLKSFEVFPRKPATGELGARKTLLISVSLSAAFEDGFEEARTSTSVEMKDAGTGFTPDAEALVPGAPFAGGRFYLIISPSPRLSGMSCCAITISIQKTASTSSTDWQALASTIADPSCGI